MADGAAGEEIVATDLLINEPKKNRHDPIMPLGGADWEHVYEPAEDTFLFMDALEADLPFIQEMKPTVVLELGTGSGTISAFLASLYPGPCFIATDRNPTAATAAQRTFAANEAPVDVVVADLFSGIRVRGGIDILLFNPPYVPTPPDEINSSAIAMSWAGGDKGREVVDRVFADLDKHLSPKGCMYVVALDSNDPKEIAAWMGTKGFRTKVVKKRTAGIERLLILRIWRDAPQPETAPEP
ncbi:S-adenosyl-L-methionine-dependent methyltransferase [Baffinella frigidus]|nr:S-adenosyl-L-methionine-dependent methyltransferase [Cryptophyta sp. CCMP2293]|mmetsp:Transcript_36465/g.86322  ORF Transcript_36465/g.86322 Transcript_36465/m.86322 type:complete len:241 (+) Transcript_36465:360-1082(+)